MELRKKDTLKGWTVIRHSKIKHLFSLYISIMFMKLYFTSSSHLKKHFELVNRLIREREQREREGNSEETEMFLGILFPERRGEEERRDSQVSLI